MPPSGSGCIILLFYPVLRLSDRLSFYLKMCPLLLTQTFKQFLFDHFETLHVCFCQGLKMCMRIGCKPATFLLHYCCLNSFNFGSTQKRIYTAYLENAFSYNFTRIFIFCQGLKMCMRFDCNPQI